MRVESIISAFVIVLGNAVLHLALAILAGGVVIPTQSEMDALVSSEVEVGDYSCVSVEELESALNYA